MMPAMRTSSSQTYRYFGIVHVARWGLYIIVTFNFMQFSKGTARNPRKITFSIDGKDEVLNYRIVPCGGVKLCGKQAEGCTYVVARRERARCLDHPQVNNHYGFNQH